MHSREWDRHSDGILVAPRGDDPDRSRQRHRVALGERRERLADRIDGGGADVSGGCPPARGAPGRFRARPAPPPQDRARSRYPATADTPPSRSREAGARPGSGARALRRRTRTARDLPAPAAAISVRVCRPPAAAPSSRGFRAARASRRTPAGPTASAPCACSQTTARDRQRTSRRSARPADQSLRDRTDRRWRRPARNRPAIPSARSPAPAPASAPICRRRTRGPMAPPFARTRSW